MYSELQKSYGYSKYGYISIGVDEKQGKRKRFEFFKLCFLKNTTGTVNQQGDQKAVKESMSDNPPQTNYPRSSEKSPKVMAEDAEIRWALKVILSHFSYRLCLGTNKLFKTMFPDSAMAKEFSVSNAKCAYVHFVI